MNKQPSLKLNMVMNGILTMSSIIFPLITFPYISRVLLPVGNGKISLATSVVAYFAMFAQLGIPTYGVRACAKVRDDKKELSRVVHELLMIGLAVTIAVYLAFFATIFAVPKFNAEKELYVITGATILLNTLGVEWLYRALEKYTYITVRSVVFKVIGVAAMFMLVREQSDYVIYGAIAIFAGSASNILNFINLRKLIYIKPVGGYNCRRHLKMVMVFFLMSIATTVYTNLDNVMLGFMKNDEAVGYYSAAVKIKTLLVSMITSASMVLLPRASYYVDKGLMEEFRSILKRTMNLMLLLAIPCAAYFMIYAKEGILLLSGASFIGAVKPMVIIMPTLILIAITNVIGIQMLVPLGRERDVLHSEIAGAVVDFVLNLFLIPSYGVSGAAIATLVAEMVVLVWQILVCGEHIIDVKILLVVTGATALAAGLCSLVKLMNMGVILSLILSAGIFGIIYLPIALVVFKREIL